MAERCTVDLFAEDRAHEGFLRPLLTRIFREQNVAFEIQTISTRGGSPVMKRELSNYHKLIRQRQQSPDLLVVVRDTNCSEWNQVHSETAEWVDKTFFPHSSIACPDPHIERWFMADPSSFQQVVNAQCPPGRRKCERGLYKKILVEAIREGGYDTRIGGIEFAQELVEEMDLYQAGKNEPSLGIFVDDLHKIATRLKR